MIETSLAYFVVMPLEAVFFFVEAILLLEGGEKNLWSRLFGAVVSIMVGVWFLRLGASWFGVA